MTVDQVAAASGGKLLLCGSDCGELKPDKLMLRGLYQTGEFEFTALAYFNIETGQLTSISLMLRDPRKADKLYSEMKAKYGEPNSESRTGSLAISVWRDGTDQINGTFWTDRTAVLSYRPRLNASNKGL
ncbi:hypothetical protein [Bradyrhizobium sp. RDM4]|uniref:hypothetical protein n=1 Tax=Bradyrhizobium sp. RDM4 TaxID=3378765 RepID=UPI0038FCCDCE